MRPPLIVLVPWISALLLEIWLITILIRKKLFKNAQVFTAVVVMYAIVDMLVLGAALTRFQTYTMYTLREITSTVLRTWLLIEICRHLLAHRQWTRRLIQVALLCSVLLLFTTAFPLFTGDQTQGIGTAFLKMGVWFRTVYFTQIGVVAMLFLLYFRSLDTTFSRDFGIAIGLATASGAELVSLTLRGRPELGNPYLYVALNYVGMMTATAIWIMFMSAPLSRVKVNYPRGPSDSGEMAAD